MPSQNVIVALDKRYDFSKFDCGEPALNDYLKCRAGQEMASSVSAIFVLPYEGVVIGFYTLCACSIKRSSLPLEFNKRLPKYERLPTVLIGRMAVDKSYQGCGAGKMLLVNALKRSFEQSRQVGAIAVMVDAKDEKASAFYKHFGFQEIPLRPLRLFISMKRISALKLDQLDRVES